MDDCGELARMFGVALDEELPTLQEVAIRAGILWRCGSTEYGDTCNYVNDNNFTTCTDCGATREADDD